MSTPNICEFVFLDDRPWPYFVSDRSGEWWLYYWSDGNKCFVTLRKITLQDCAKFSANALPHNQAKFYLKREVMTSR